MCGFAGFLDMCPSRDGDAHSTILDRMGDSLRHRGPDGEGKWIDLENGIGLVHRRLAIVDLSPAGAQPMLSTCGRYVIVFNGEIYNHLELRKTLSDSTVWRGHSDTETLLVAVTRWGVEGALNRCIGMFAIALWDRELRTLTLARDRIGEKPLYYGWQGNVFLFGSELKVLKAHPAFYAGIDRNSLSLYMRHNYIPVPYSIYQGIAKLAPGCWLTISLTQRDPQISSYWSGSEIVRQGIAHPFEGSPAEAVTTLETLLRDAVNQQMMADVPLGAFLSGGVDSSLVVALMQAQSNRPVKTFSIGFYENEYNEAAYAKAVAKHLDTDHTELYVSPAECMAVIPSLPILYDEPFADSSQIPTFIVSKLARQHVTVSLSGDAGDELFAGYNRHQLTANTWGKLSQIPQPIREWAAKAITRVSPNSWSRIATVLQPILPIFGRWANIGDKLHKGAQVMPSRSANDLYLRIVSNWEQPTNVILNAKEPPSLFAEHLSGLSHLNITERMMVLDLLTYLPDDILCKVDRASMGVSLESRVPFLDHRVVEFAWRLPLEYKLREDQTKWILRQVLYRYVPKNLIERPKMGFSMPIDSWLRGSLRDWAEDLLSESRLKHDGYFKVAPIRQKWQEHLSGQYNWQNQLWNLLMFQTWLDKQ